MGGETCHPKAACDAAHWRRHGAHPDSKKCGRCIFIRSKADLLREHPWLTPRPSYMGGHWRLGCSVCRWMFSNSQKETHHGRRGCKVRASVFASFNFMPPGFLHRLHDRVRAHGIEDGHRLAVIASRKSSKMLPACERTQYVLPLLLALILHSFLIKRRLFRVAFVLAILRPSDRRLSAFSAVLFEICGAL